MKTKQNLISTRQRCVLLIGLALLEATLQAGTVQFTTLVNFADVDGDYPIAKLTQGADGNFYGTTYYGGSSGNGTIFKMTPGGALTTLVDFAITNGQYPQAGLTPGLDGNFYGTTWEGGTNSYGTIFKMTPSGNLTTLVHLAFTNGSAPGGTLTMGSNGLFFGTTVGGVTLGNNDGSVFTVSPEGNLTLLHAFSPTQSNTNAGGCNPYYGLTLGGDGNFYGTTFHGGSSGFGTAFKVTADGTFTTLADFNGTNGANPNGQLTLGQNGSFYGTTFQGGSYDQGTVFKVTSSGALTNLVSFNGDNGAHPAVGLTLGQDGNFYGTTGSGGESGSSLNGTLFKMTPDGTLTTLVNFGGTNGTEPQALTMGNDGNLYGTTSSGGSYNYGTVFKLALSTATPASLNIQRITDNVVLSWFNAAYSLQSAPEATGAYTNIPGASSPYTNPLTGPQHFFRLISY